MSPEAHRKSGKGAYFQRVAPLASGIILLPAVAVGLWLLLDWQLDPQTSEERREIMVLLAQVLVGLALLTGVYLTWRRITATERTVEVAQEGQITERFTRAIEQLGSDKVQVRLGGIYALERIARNSQQDHWPIIEVLTAYVRETTSHAGYQEPVQGEARKQPAHDIEAILTVIQRRNLQFEAQGQRLDLARAYLVGANLHGANLLGVNLLGANLNGAHLIKANLSRAYLSEANLSEANLSETNLSGANFSEANLSWANLSKANLSEANLSETNLSGADLSEADLSGANFSEANLSETDLTEANLREANLSGAILSGADLSLADLTATNLVDTDLTRVILPGADLREVRGLTQEQLQSAAFYEGAQLPDYLTEHVEEAGQNPSTIPESEASGKETP